jgi:hypothetical protein
MVLLPDIVLGEDRKGGVEVQERKDLPQRR